ncbi:hypothetical protein GQ607_012144 [Colletotrichum asianum]|uniref:Uncharacterized protein n=1 Tax=Colletotrichum asianum TaxID=702518 RepID=A0A8H3W3L3_9PEZI|nr:hypothetical protein GQ607_012144 [Colletotrichum asianum]
MRAILPLPAGIPRLQHTRAPRKRKVIPCLGPDSAPIHARRVCKRRHQARHNKRNTASGSPTCWISISRCRPSCLRLSSHASSLGATQDMDSWVGYFRDQPMRLWTGEEVCGYAAARVRSRRREETTTNQRRHTSRKSDIPPAMQRDKMGDPETTSLPGPRPNQPIPSLNNLQTMGCALLNRLQVLGPKNGSGWPRHERGTTTISGSRTRNTPIGLSCVFFLSMESDTGTRTNRNCKVVRVLPPCREHGWL